MGNECYLGVQFQAPIMMNVFPQSVQELIEPAEIVHIHLFTKDFKMVLFKRSDGFWMPVAGKVEPKETYLDAAHREMWEETGILLNGDQVKLSGICCTTVGSRMFELRKHGEVCRWSASIVGKKFNHGICSTGGYLVCAQIVMIELRREVQLIMSTQKWLTESLSARGKGLVGKKDKEDRKLISYFFEFSAHKVIIEKHSKVKGGE